MKSFYVVVFRLSTSWLNDLIKNGSKPILNLYKFLLRHKLFNEIGEHMIQWINLFLQAKMKLTIYWLVITHVMLWPARGARPISLMRNIKICFIMPVVHPYTKIIIPALTRSDFIDPNHQYFGYIKMVVNYLTRNMQSQKKK
jgi:hypothetical protein